MRGPVHTGIPVLAWIPIKSTRSIHPTTFEGYLKSNSCTYLTCILVFWPVNCAKPWFLWFPEPSLRVPVSHPVFVNTLSWFSSWRPCACTREWLMPATQAGHVMAKWTSWLPACMHVPLGNKRMQRTHKLPLNSDQRYNSIPISSQTMETDFCYLIFTQIKY